MHDYQALANEALQKLKLKMGQPELAECLLASKLSIKKNLYWNGAPQRSQYFSVLPSFIKNNQIQRHTILGSTVEACMAGLTEIGSSAPYLLEEKPHEFSRDKSIGDVKQTADLRPQIQEDMFGLLDQMQTKLRREWKTYEVNMFVECIFEDLAYANTHRVSGSYARSRTGIHFYVSHRKKKIEKRGFLENCTQLDSFLERLDRSMNRFQDAQEVGKEIYIKGGQSSVILSPKVVEKLCGIISAYTIEDKQWPKGVYKALPKDFNLVEEPLAPDFPAAAIPFDHEGVTTSPKVLCKGPKRVEAGLTDLNLAYRKNKTQSTGNGFRRSLFSTEMGDSVAAIYPSYLKLMPGSGQLETFIQDNEELVIIDNIYAPLDRSEDLVSGSPMIVIRGDYYKKGQFFSRVYSQNYARRPLISCFPKSYGSLLDPKAKILSNGESTSTGWFPYVYLPVLTWSKG